MTSAVPTTPKPTSQSLPPDTVPVPRLTSQSGYRTGDLSEGRRAVLFDLRRYLLVPYATLVHSALGSLPEVSQTCKVLNAIQYHPPSRSNNPEGEAFEPLGDLISNVFEHVSTCPFTFAANPFKSPFSTRGNTSRPDAYITRPHAGDTKWFDIAIPFEFKKENHGKDKYDNEQKMIWSLHNIMREDPLRRFAFGITVEDTDMRIWHSSRTFLAVSEPIDFIKEIDDVIALFYAIGTKTAEELGWDPTVERFEDKAGKTQYRFMIGGKHYTTIEEPLATYGADAMVGRGTRVFKARDDDGNIVAIKDSWRDESRESEGEILERIFRDIRATLGDEEAAEAEKYFVRIQHYEDVIISGKVDKTLTLPQESGDMKWVPVMIDPPLSSSRHIPSVGDIPDSGLHRVTPPTTRRAPHDGGIIPCGTIPRRIHQHVVFKDVGIPLMQTSVLADCFSCLSGARKALHYLHKAGWVHRDFSVTNVIWANKEDHFIGKLSDLEYAKKVDCETSHDVRTGTMHFMAVEVEAQKYLFRPALGSGPINLFGRIDKPPFRMNFLHDLESLWWTATWILFYHTDTKSPTECPDAQKAFFEEAFPDQVAQVSRLLSFKNADALVEAYDTLSTTYGGCRAFIQLAADLQRCYSKAEEPYPSISLDDNLLEEAHRSVLSAISDVAERLDGSCIRLQPLRSLKGKRKVDDSPCDRASKRAGRGF